VRSKSALSIKSSRTWAATGRTHCILCRNSTTWIE